MQRWTPALLAIGAVLLSTHAQAYCRKTTCRYCEPDSSTLCVTEGQPLYWPGACVSYAVARQASWQVDEATASAIAQTAFDAWRNVICPDSGLPPSIGVTDAFGPTSCALAEYSHTGANANVIAFRDADWSTSDADESIGVTTLTFDPVSGEILDADIEINSTDVILSTTPGTDLAAGKDDLQSILTHEAGHFLGLGHSTDPDSVMRPKYDPGTASLRVPSADDIAGICAIYPPFRRAQPCNFTPKRGFANECPLGVFKGGCAVGRTPGSHAGWAFVGFVFGCVALRRGATRRRGSIHGAGSRGQGR